MKLREVKTKQDDLEFIRLPDRICKNDKNYIPALRQDIRKIFDPKQNKLFREGVAIRWILEDDKGEIIGRVAAFIHPKTSKSFKQPTGGMGFFDSIDNKDAAFMLFDACKNWLAERGMQAMDGPINFGEKDRFWGLLVENFTDPPTYAMNYNPPYYQKFFEEYGFKLYYKQLVYSRRMRDPAQEIFQRKDAMLKTDPRFRVGNVRGMSLDEMANNFMIVYNGAWAGSDGFKSMSLMQSKLIFKSMKQVIDPDIIVFVYYDDAPIGFWVNIPELNQIFKHVHGNLNLWGKLLFLWHKKRHTSRIMYGLVFGVVREMQGRGVEALMVKYGEDVIVPLNRFDDTVITWVGDFNPRMIKICESLGARNYRNYITYRYLFDRNAVYERSPLR